LRQALGRLDYCDPVKEIGQEQGSLDTGDGSVIYVLVEGVRGEEAVEALDQLRGRLALDQDGGLDEIVEPVPGGNA